MSAIATTDPLEVISYGDLGRRVIQHAKRQMTARQAGIEIGVKFGLDFLDKRLNGLKPGEMVILAGEPGTGKSAVSFAAARKFADRQTRKPKGQQMGTLIASLEMGDIPTGERFAQAEAGIDGERMRDGRIEDWEMSQLIKLWGAQVELPLWFSFAPVLKTDQIRVMVEREVRDHNLGLFVVDHMRFVSATERYDSISEEDEGKAAFFKQLAREMEVAIILLAHTTKAVENRFKRRPTLSDLRGGGMAAAHADAVCFTYNCFQNATEDERLDGKVAPTDFELIFGKNRNGPVESSFYKLDPTLMRIEDRIPSGNFWA